MYIYICIYIYINEACKQRLHTHTRNHTNADTEALRGSPVKRDISPKKSPGLSVATSVIVAAS